jgi:hypothetical protein
MIREWAGILRRNTKIASSAAVLSFVTLVSASILAREPKASDFFPLTVGTYWVYQGSVTWFDQDKNAEEKKEVSLTMSVEKVFRKGDTIFAVIDGFPSDLNFSTGEVKPSRWVMIETENGKNEVFLHDLDPGVTLPATDDANPGPVLDSMMTDDNLLLEWPMARGNRFCDADSQKRDDAMYCWIVESSDRKATKSLNGGAHGESVPVFTLAYRTNPDDTQIEVAPGIGIVSYRYHHHGTTADTDLKLSEFHPATEKAAILNPPQ